MPSRKPRPPQRSGRICSVVDELIAASHDVEWVGRLTPGILDMEVLRQVAIKSRILLTLNKDYGDLAYRSETTTLVRTRRCLPASS
jgi:hypothetical protein